MITVSALRSSSAFLYFSKQYTVLHPWDTEKKTEADLQKKRQELSLSGSLHGSAGWKGVVSEYV